MLDRVLLDLGASLITVVLIGGATLLALWGLVRLVRAAVDALRGNPSDVYEYEAGVLYRRGRLERSLEAGRHYVARWRGERVVVVDLRRQLLDLRDQRVLTADHVPVGLNVSLEYCVDDPRVALHAVAEYAAQLHEDTQLAVRDVVGSLPVDEMLAGRAEVNSRILARVLEAASTYGLRVLRASIKDVVLSAKVRDLLLRETEARRAAQAMLVGAREEVAALRAMANAAQMVRESPELLRLRELETLRAVAQAGGNTVVVGLGGAPPPLPGHTGAPPKA